VRTIEDVVKFAKARHRVWEGKGTKSRILTTRKFTNVFRVLDRGSQYLLDLMNLLDDPLDRLALSYFYRQVNRPDTMDEIIAANDGYVPEAAEIFDPAWYERVVAPVAAARPGKFLSGAYMILIKPSDPRPTVEKMQAVFPAARPWLEHVASEPDLPVRVMLLQETPGLGPFMAMQIATDFGYTKGEPDQENTFILPGPGSRMGVGFLLGKKYATDAEARKVIQEFPVELLPALPHSNGRPASWMDIQNVFCEFSKYARMVDRKDKGAATPYRPKPHFDVTIPAQFVLKK
jgi:hypothetical protein